MTQSGEDDDVDEFVVVSMIDEVGLLESECVRNGRLRSGTTGLAAHLYE